MTDFCEKTTIRHTQALNSLIIRENTGKFFNFELISGLGARKVRPSSVFLEKFPTLRNSESRSLNRESTLRYQGIFSEQQRSFLT
jgi:hypothetical protein